MLWAWCEIQGTAYDLHEKKKYWDFLVAQEQKLSATGHQALLEHSPGI